MELKRKKKLIKYLETNLRPYLTKEEWEEMLPKYIKNHFNFYFNEDIDIFKGINDPEKIILIGFPWDTNSEVYYWEMLWKKIQNRSNKVPLI